MFNIFGSLMCPLGPSYQLFSCVNNMPSKHETLVKRLNELGYALKEAKTALRRCNYNLEAATDYLMNTTESEKQGDTLNQDRLISAQSHIDVDHAAERHIFTSNVVSTSGNIPQKPVRVHPCIVQYGVCKYGDTCKYATMPGNICLNYLHGGCAFGSLCRNLHSVHNTELLSLFPEEAVTTRCDAYGALYIVSDENSPRLGPSISTPDAAKCLAPHPCIVQCGECKFGEKCKYRGIPGDVCVFWLNGKCRSENGRTCPYRHTAENACILDTVPNDLSCSTVSGDQDTSIQNQTDNPSTRTVGNTASTLLHPCVVQCGACKFGNKCKYREVSGEVCVHWLNGRCRSTQMGECSFLHTLDKQSSLNPISTDDVDYAAISNDFIRQDTDPNPAYEHEQIVANGTLSNLEIDEISGSIGQDEQTHPCITQCGGCKFGDACTFRDVPNNICLRWLKGKCFALSESCPFAHDAEASLLSWIQEQQIVRQSCKQNFTSNTLCDSITSGIHPCVTQFGSCKYGSKCKYAQVADDVCVHWLNGKCAYAGTQRCQYRHPTEEEKSKANWISAETENFSPLSLESDVSLLSPETAPFVPQIISRRMSTKQEQVREDRKLDSYAHTAMTSEIESEASLGSNEFDDIGMDLAEMVDNIISFD